MGSKLSSVKASRISGAPLVETYPTSSTLRITMSGLERKLIQYLAALGFWAYLGITQPSNHTVAPSLGQTYLSSTPASWASSMAQTASPLQVRFTQPLS